MNSVVEKILLGIGLAVIAVVLVFVVSFLLAYPVKWLWNATLPELFGFKTIGVWMAWKLNFLSGLLLKSTSTSSSKSK